MKLSQAIIEIRKEKGLTQEDFAKEFNVTRQTVSNWENGKSYPDLLTLVKISDLYGYSLDRMLREDRDMTEAMNKSIEVGKQLRRKTVFDYLFPVMGFVCCSAMVVISVVDYSGALSVTIWGLCALMDLFFLFEVIKSTKLHDNIEEQFSKLTDDDLEIIKKISDRGLDVLAVKMVRVITGVGLLEAKTLVSELKNQ